MSNPWMLIVIAGVLETAWAIGLKYTVGFTRFVPSSLTLLALAGSMYLLAKASTQLPIGTAYAVWVGIGAAGAGVLGIALFKEPLTFPCVFFLSMLVLSIVGLKFSSH